uniref:ATP receptor n=2 Tax=Haptolina ericina TaxID=156174 RepID=A0A7S3FG13_9EUKA
MELSHGTVAVTLSHNPNISAYMVTNGVVSAADEADLVQPLKEGAALFLATTRATTPMQKLGNCTDPSTSCRHDADCSVGGHTDPPLSYGICDESSGYCITQGWCPKPYTAGANTQVSQLDGIEHLAITLIGTIDFPRLGGKNNWMTTEDGRNAKVTWSLPTVLKRGGVDQVEVTASGAVLSLVLKWSCQLGPGSKECLPALKVYDIGKGAGFYNEYAQYYQQSEGGTPVLHRDLNQARGIRLLVSSRGVARKIDAYACVLQLFVALALIPIASMLADLIMQNLFSERRHYREYKTETTPDFSDVRAKVEQMEKHTKSQNAKRLEYGEEA